MLSRLGFPPVAGNGRFVAALGIDAIGSGVWMPLSVLYFLRTTGLSLVQVGLAITLAGAVAFPFVLLTGQLVDRYGAKRVMQGGNVLQGLGFALYPFAGPFVSVVVLVAVTTLGRTAFWSSNGPMIADITAPGERELWFGFVGAMRNAGFGIGGILAAVALSVGTPTAYQVVVLANAASYVGALGLLAGFPHGRRPAAGVARLPGGWADLLRDRPYLWLVAATFGYALAESTLNVAMPVYIADVLRLAGWVPGVVFVVNTVMIGLGQGVVVRAMTGVRRSRLMLGAVGFTAASFAMLWAADPARRPWALAIVLAAAVVYTVGELVFGPVIAALSAETPPARLRGRYLAATQLAWNAAGVAAPVLFATLLHHGAAAMWGGGLVVCLAWTGALLVVRRSVPRARERVTNAAASLDRDDV